jgi:hypothetical protein
MPNLLMLQLAGRSGKAGGGLGGIRFTELHTGIQRRASDTVLKSGEGEDAGVFRN